MGEINKPKVVLINSTPNPIKTIYMAARTCYSSEFIVDQFNDEIPIREKMETLIDDILASGHRSILEHVSYTFAIDGISRSETHQHVRHRMASYSQQSQRYCDMTNSGSFNFVVPKSIKNNNVAYNIYTNTMKYINNQYNILKEVLSQDLNKSEEVNQDARYILPNSCTSKLVTTMNVSSLLHFFEMRCCNRAQHEIRYVANEMRRLCLQDCYILFKNSGPKCNRLGYCPEGEKFTCGKKFNNN